MRPRIKHNEAVLVGVGVLLSIAVHGAFVIHGFGEPDIARLVVAAAEWHLTGQTLYQSYIFRTSALYIHLIKKLLDMGLPLASVPTFLNWMSVVLGSLTMIPLYLLWKRLCNRGVAALACVFFLFTPAYWLANVYGMAHVPAFALFVLALPLYALAVERQDRLRLPLFAGAAALGIVAVALKADMILCYGAFLGMAYYRRKIEFQPVFWAIAIPFLAFTEATVYARYVAPNLAGLTEFTGAWSGRFPFTTDAFTDPYNRSVLVNSMGRMLVALVVGVVAYCVVRRRHLRELVMTVLWALPPILFWGLKLGNSSRHMMAAICVLMFFVAVVLSGWIRGALRVSVVVLVLTLNYLLGPGDGDAISPTPTLHVLNREVQGYVNNLHDGGVAFATFPTPAKMFVGGPGAPYAVFEVMTRAKAIETHESDDPPTDQLDVELAENWPRYVAEYDNGSYVIGITQVVAPYKMPPMEKWFCFSVEPGIMTRNNMAMWRPYIQEAIQNDPKSADTWTINARLRIEAGIALTEVGELQQALRYFEEALSARPDLADALWNTAVLKAHFGQERQARRLFERFVKQHPNDPRAQIARDELLTD